MMTFLLATHNPNKAREFREIFSTLPSDIGECRLLTFDDLQDVTEVEETGNTFEENALIKARDGAKRGYITIADDSGLAVDALGGAPGIYSARYSGVHGDDLANNRVLLEHLVGVTDRSAHYVCAIACVFPDGREFTVRGECDGVILTEPSAGKGGFGYDPLFYIPACGRTFADMTPEEKNTMSHRAVAIRRFACELLKYISKDSTC